MKKKGEKKVLSRFDGLNSERRFAGRTAVCGAETVIGRISFFDEGYTEGSVLLLYGDEQIERASLLLRPPIAIVVVCCGEGESFGDLCTLGVPCMMLEWEESLGRGCKNKVALIDTERGIFTLDPSIDTINFYSKDKSKDSARGVPCAEGRRIRHRGEGIHGADFEHFLVSSEIICEGGGFFESAVALWEERCPELMTVEMRVPDGSESSAHRFSEQVEELFRASLYGSFALAVSDFFCEEELCRALKLLHKAFCVLEAEGREFNGYIPRGLIFSSPLWLARPCPVTNPDFIIFDLDSLLPRLFGLDAEQIIKKEKALKKELFGVFERYFVSFMPRCEIYAKAESFFGTRLLQELVKALDIKIAYH